MKISAEQIEDFLVNFEKREQSEIATIIERHLDSDSIEVFADHIEEFYDVDNDEEIALLTQILITGFVTAKELASTQIQ